VGFDGSVAFIGSGWHACMDFALSRRWLATASFGPIGVAFLRDAHSVRIGPKVLDRPVLGPFRVGLTIPTWAQCPNDFRRARIAAWMRMSGRRGNN
jgi:hypothetical protein